MPLSSERFDKLLAAERGRFVLFLPVFMAGGVVAYFARTTEPPLWPAALIVAAAVGGAWALRHSVLVRAVLLCVAFGCAGFASARLAAWRAAPWVAVPRGAVVIAGRVAQLELLPEGRRITIAAPSFDGGTALARQMRVRLRNADPVVLMPGDGVTVRALLRPPPAPAYPGGWDMQRDAYFRGMDAYGFAIGPAARTSVAGGGAWQALRAGIAARVMEVLPGGRGAVAATLLTGLAAGIPPVDRAAFQDSGLAHLLAVAGLHIGIVMAWVFAVVRTGLAAWEYAALHWPVKRIAALSALGAGFFYLALTGAHVPILRSFAMASLVTLGVLTGRRAISVRALALAALLLMLAAPAEVMGVSFQMSFAAVLALVAGWEMGAPWLAMAGVGRWWRAPALYAGGLVLTSFLAGTASLPFAAYHFGNATTFYVPANMLAVPLTAFWVMPLGLVALGLMPFGAERLALVPMGWGVDGLLAIGRTVSAWPAAVTRVPQMPPWGLLLVAGGLVWLCIWRTRLRLGGVAPLLAGLASPWLVVPPDVLVVPDARVIAARVGGDVLVSMAKGAGSFERDEAARVWGREATAFPDEGSAAGGAVTCAGGDCRIRFGGGTALLALTPDAACGEAALVVSPVAWRGNCGAALVADRFSVLRDGATTVWLQPGGAVRVTDQDLRGTRPWVIAAPATGTPSRLPPAMTE